MELINWVSIAAIFGFGLIIGSFLNCVVFRFGKKRGALKGRSYCPKCRHQLAWFDLVPLFSFLALGGRCRYCQKPISWQYPAVESATGILFLAAAKSFAPLIFSGKIYFFQIVELSGLWIALAAMVVIFLVDLRHYLIPDSAVLAGVAGSLAVWAGRLFFDHSLTGRFDWQIVANPLAAAAFAGAFFLAIFLAGKGKWLGFGDVKFSVFMGSFLGFPQILIALFCANFFGAIMGLGLIAAKKKKLSSAVPFGPFLAAGTLIALFWGQAIVNWYIGI